MQRGSSQFKMQLMLLWKESLKKFRLAGIRTLTTAIPELVALIIIPIELASQVEVGHWIAG